jgi:hypothetical protein
MYCQPQMTRKDRSSAARSRTTPISAGKGKVKVVAQSRHEAGRARRRQARRPADVRDAEDVRGAVGRRSGKKESERVTTGVSLLDDLGAGVRDRKRAWTTCRGQAGDLHLLSSSTRREMTHLNEGLVRVGRGQGHERRAALAAELALDRLARVGRLVKVSLIRAKADEEGYLSPRALRLACRLPRAELVAP